MKAWRLLSNSKKAFLFIVWSVSAIYVFGFCDRGWVPHDEGAIAQSAERVLSGEMPHRDFDEIYTGGLTYLHAAAFKTLGLNLISLRVVLLVFFLGFVPAFYALAVRLAPPVVAAMITLVGVVWSVPNYFASIPSWYNLFFATFGTLTLCLYIETRQARWLLAAGLLGGLSILVKITGLYYIAAALLFLTFREQLSNDARTEPQRNPSQLFLLIKLAGILIFLAGLMTFFQWRPNLMQAIYFVIPQIAVCGVLLWFDWRGKKYPAFDRLMRLCGLLFPFVIGVGVPIAVFVTLYFVTGSLGDAYKGLFVLPHKRFDSAAKGFLPALTAIAGLPYAAIVFLVSSRTPTRMDRLFGFILIGFLSATLYFSDFLVVRAAVWESARFLGIVAVLAGCQILVRSISHEYLDDKRRQLLFLLTCMTGLISLVQFPFAGYIYFCYTAPFVCLTLLAALGGEGGVAKFCHLIVLSFYFVFAIAWTNTGYVAIGIEGTRYPATVLLDAPRARLRVGPQEGQLYNQVLDLVQKHGRSSYIYAAPDCPEVYFLTGMRNPTRDLFDFLGDTERDARSLQSLFEEKRINLVVINREPEFSSQLNHNTILQLRDDFPHFVDIGRFTVRWKD